MAKEPLRKKQTVGDYAKYWGDSDNNTGDVHAPKQRDPNGPNPNQDELVRCDKCGQEYLEHHVKFVVRGGRPAWWCKNQNCEGKNIGEDINYVNK